MGTSSPNLVQLAMLTYALDVSHDTNLPTPRRERSARIMIALVCREPGIDADHLAAHLHVKASYILMLGLRLSLKGRLRHDGLHFWPPDTARRSDNHADLFSRAQAGKVSASVYPSWIGAGQKQRAPSQQSPRDGDLA